MTKKIPAWPHKTCLSTNNKAIRDGKYLACHMSVLLQTFTPLACECDVITSARSSCYIIKYDTATQEVPMGTI